MTTPTPTQPPVYNSNNIRHLHSVEYLSQRTIYGREATYIETFLVDQNNNRVTNREVFKLFKNMQATGIFVKCKLDTQNTEPHPYITANSLPWLGPITQIDATHIYIGSAAIPRELFHKLYELD